MIPCEGQIYHLTQKKGDLFAFEDEKKPRKRFCVRGKWWL